MFAYYLETHCSVNVSDESRALAVKVLAEPFSLICSNLSL